MWAICLQEFKGLIKGVRSILVLGFIVGVSILSANMAERFGSMTGEVAGENEYTLGLAVSILFFGLLFVFILSHDTISKEIQQRTIRFLVSKTSRNKILIGKFLGITLFWGLVLVLSVSIISVIAKMFFFKTLIQCFAFLLYSIASAILVSTLCAKGSQSLFVGILISLMLPIITIVVTVKDYSVINWLKYLTPYYYMDLAIPYLLIVILLSSFILIPALTILEKRDL